MLINANELIKTQTDTIKAESQKMSRLSFLVMQGEKRTGITTCLDALPVHSRQQDLQK